MKFILGDSLIRRGSKLPDQDLNLDKQNQNLLCYRYTIGQVKAGRSVSEAFLRSQALITDQNSEFSEVPELAGRAHVGRFVMWSIAPHDSRLCRVPV